MNYPTGTQHDPRAPWNEPETKIDVYVLGFIGVHVEYTCGNTEKQFFLEQEELSEIYPELANCEINAIVRDGYHFKAVTDCGEIKISRHDIIDYIL
jgi:hypothetical protein